MFSKSLIISLSVLLALKVKAGELVPTGPAPGANFTAGQDCLIQWDEDTTGLWTDTLIQLMAGSNLDMQVLETVATVDGTTTSSYTWTCPEVDPYSEIYFYQFSIPGNTSSYTWTGRWTIASPDGETVAPPNSTVSDGETIYWGNAVLLSGSTSNNSTSSSTTGSVSVTTSVASIIANSTSTSATTSAASTSAPGSNSGTGASDSGDDSGTQTSTVVVRESFTSSSSSSAASATGSTSASDDTSAAGKLTVGSAMVVALGLWSLV